MSQQDYEGFDLTMYNLFTLLREMYYTRGETETSFLQKSGGTITGSVTIQGNLVVNGQSYSIDTENLKVGDYTITLAKDNEQTLTSMVGMVVPKYDGTNYGFFGWDADGYAYVGDLTNYDGTSAITLANNSSLQRISTIDTTNTVVASNGVIYVYDATSHCFKKPTNDNKYYVIRNGEFVETELFTEQKSKNIDNALYNLGAFDTISGNTITRQTGYVDLGSLNWTYNGNNRYVAQAPSDMPSVAAGTTPDWKCGTKEPAPNTVSLSTHQDAICYVSGELLTYASSNTAPTPTGLLQYKLATSYTEQVIENQPLLNLDSNGCNFLRNEWEKGLNLFSGLKTYQYSTSDGSRVINSSYLGTDYIEVKPNTTYTLSDFPTYTNHCVFYYTSSTTYISRTSGDNVSTRTFTTPNNCYYIAIGYTNSLTSAQVSEGLNANIMLNSGTHAYPYQEYNGAIVHTKDIEPVLLWENSSPNSAFAGQTITTKTMSKKYIIVGAKYYKDNVWGTQFFKFAREDVNYYCQIGTFFRLITIVNDTSITITNNKDITTEQDANNNNLVITSISETNIL